MSYSAPMTISYALGNQDFGAADDNYIIVGPPGKAGRVREIFAIATEVFTATTTAASIQVGTAADPDAYAIMTFATDAVDDVRTASGGSSATNKVNIAEIPATSTGAQVHVDAIGTTGGTPTGQAECTITIDWY